MTSQNVNAQLCTVVTIKELNLIKLSLSERAYSDKHIHMVSRRESLLYFFFLFSKLDFFYSHDYYMYIVYNTSTMINTNNNTYFVIILIFRIRKKAKKGKSVVMKITMDLAHILVLLAAVICSASAYSSK